MNSLEKKMNAWDQLISIIHIQIYIPLRSYIHECKIIQIVLNSVRFNSEKQ